MDLITDPINGNQDFSYDALDRLTSAVGPYGTGGATATFTYTYNQIGNMLSNPQVGTYSYPTSGAGIVRPHAATVVGTYPLTYDNNGNMLTLTDPTGFYGYNATYNTDNRLSSVTTTYNFIPTTSTFIYDGDGGRVKKIDGATTTRYVSKLYECDTTGANTSCSRFIWANDTRVATVATNGTVHYWHGDHLGSSSVITDSTGAKVQALTYYPYGDVRTNVPGTPVNVPYKFTGMELDASSNLYFYEARYYHAIFGRFISPDTLVPDPLNPQHLNRYSYAGNNPLRYLDPSGHEGIDSSFWPSEGIPQFDGVSVRGGRMGQESFFNIGSYALRGEYTPFDYSRSWVSDSFGGGRLGLDPMMGRNGLIGAGSSDVELLVPEVTVTGVRPDPFTAFSTWGDSAQQRLGMMEAVPFPFISTPAGVLNAGTSFVRGRYGEAGWSAVAAVPFLGMAGKVSLEVIKELIMGSKLLKTSKETIHYGRQGGKTEAQRTFDSLTVNAEVKSRPSPSGPEVRSAEVKRVDLFQCVIFLR